MKDQPPKKMKLEAVDDFCESSSDEKFIDQERFLLSESIVS